jgi:Domain of unknown function (DUF6867)
MAMTQALLGTSFGVFFGITALLTGFAAFMTGQAIANTWRPYWQVVVYCGLLGAAARFLIYGLFDGALWSLSGYLIGTGVLMLIGTFAFRLTRARRMVLQYPWLYKRTGLFTWQPLHPGSGKADLSRT